jgi:hypothetical protein
MIDKGMKTWKKKGKGRREENGGKYSYVRRHRFLKHGRTMK